MITPEPITHKEREDTKKSFFDDESVLPQDRAKVNDPIQGIDRVTVQPTGKRTSSDIVREMFSYSPPKPTYDPNRPEELKRLARASALGKGLNVVGDIIGLGAGANVKRRQPDNRELGYLNSMYNYIDDYNRRMDDWNWKDYMNRLRGKETELGLLEKEKDREIRDRMFQADQIWKQLGFQSDQAYKKWQMEKAEKDQELAEKRIDQQADEARQRAAIAYSRMEWDKVKHYNDMALKAADHQLKAEGKGYNLYSSDRRQKVKINDQGELQKLYTLIVNDKALQDDVSARMKLLEPSFGSPGSANEQRIIVSEFWEKSQDAQNWLKNQGKVKQAENNKSQSNWGEYFRPRYEGPLRPDTPVHQVPKQTSPQTSQQPAQSNNVINDSIKIRNTYNQLGVDITQGDDYNNALQIAIKQGIVNPNSQLTRDQANKVNEIMQQIKQDKEIIRAAGVSEGVGFTPTQQPQQNTQTEVPLFFQ